CAGTFAKRSWSSTGKAKPWRLTSNERFRPATSSTSGTENRNGPADLRLQIPRAQLDVRPGRQEATRSVEVESNAHDVRDCEYCVCSIGNGGVIIGASR